MILALLIVCASPDAPVSSVPVPAVEGSDGAEVRIPLDAPRLLRRMSIDLRGALPAPTELDAVAEDPSHLATYRDIYLEDSRFETRMVQLLGEHWLTLIDEFQVGHFDYQLDDRDEYLFERSVGQEPLRIMARIAAEDRPWTDIVTTRETMANETLASIWPIDRPEGEGWLPSRYIDGRPGAGILASNGLWWRYPTNPTNMNRGRAGVIMRRLLCHDILSRPVSFSGSAASTSGVEAAIATEPACKSCHSSVDPLAASLFGFYWLTQYNALELERYHPERELLGETYLGVAPAFFGQPVLGLADLGQAIAADPRFYRCTAQTMAGLLWRRPVELSDTTTVESLRQAFILQGGTLKPLIRAVLDTPEYRVGALTHDASVEQDQSVPTRRMLVAGQLESILEDTTGFVWTWSGYRQLDNDTLGFRNLGGGVDGDQVSDPQREPGLTWALVMKRAAQAAAQQVVSRDLSDGPGPRALLEWVDEDSRPEDPVFEDELAQLHWRLLAVPASADWLDDASALWSDAYVLSDDPQTAWTVVLTTLLRDPAFLTY